MLAVCCSHCGHLYRFVLEVSDPNQMATLNCPRHECAKQSRDFPFKPDPKHDAFNDLQLVASSPATQ